MTNKHQKLELTWIGKGDEPKLEPRILIEDSSKSFGDNKTGNMLISGDNLLALKALEQNFTNKIKCVYIDPPYNTGSAFEHYDDGIEHSLWLSLMKPRIDILRTLLCDEGTIWISVDDNEAHYLKVMCDEIFGRQNFVATIIWHKKHTRSNDARWLSDNHDFILCFAKNKEKWKRNLLPRNDEGETGYTNPDNDPRGVWASGPCHAKTPSDKTYFEVTTPTGRKILPPAGTSWRFSKVKFDELIKDNRIYFGESGNNVPRYKRFLTEVQDGLVPLTIWFKDEVGDNQEAKKEVKAFNAADVFSTPKPERLIQRILQISTKEGDFVLDSFLGSGTTAAVAHKMKRNYIGIELGEQANTHCLPRLKQVVSGEDKGGITEAVNWNGGDGFKFYNVASSLLNQDKYGNWVISKEYNPSMLAAAMAKQEGFRYHPDAHIYWKQGSSSEKDYIYTTTQFITVEMLDKIHDEMKPDENLLISCKSYQKECENKFVNISIKKIPQMLLGKCEFGKDDYSLNIVTMPMNETTSDSEIESAINEKPKKLKKTSENKSTLFV